MANRWLVLGMQLVNLSFITVKQLRLFFYVLLKDILKFYLRNILSLVCSRSDSEGDFVPVSLKLVATSSFWLTGTWSSFKSIELYFPFLCHLKPDLLHTTKTSDPIHPISVKLKKNPNLPDLYSLQYCFRFYFTNDNIY